MKKRINLFAIFVIVVILLSSCAANKAANEFDHTFKLKDSFKSHLTDDKVKAIEDFTNAYMKLFSTAVAKNDLFAMADNLDEALSVAKMSDIIEIDTETAIKEDYIGIVFDLNSMAATLSAVGAVKSANDIYVEAGVKPSEGEMYLSLANLTNSKEFASMNESEVKKAFFDKIKSRMSQILNDYFDVVK